MRVDEYSKNTSGVDYFIGDIHGEAKKLNDALCKIGFNRELDRLFCVGDLVDRGGENLECLSLLDEDWFFCVKGNHEQMMIDALTLSTDHPDARTAWEIWIYNGGSWYLDLSPEKVLMLEGMLEKVNSLPNAIKVGGIGVIHAECPLQDWELLSIDSGSYLREKAMWSRRRISRQDNWKVRGVDAVVVGHTPVKDTVVLGNHVYIDHGVCFNQEKSFTIYSYEGIIELLN